MEEELGPQTLTLVRLTETDKKMMEWDCGAYTIRGLIKRVWELEVGMAPYITTNI